MIHVVLQHALGPHPASYTMGTGSLSPEGKDFGAWLWPPTSI